MAVQRTKVQVPAVDSVSTSAPEVVNANAPVTGPVVVPDAPEIRSKYPGRRGRPTGPRGPQLSWGLVVNGVVLQKTLVDVAREVSAAHKGYATLTDLVNALKSHPTFTDNVTEDGATLADLVTPLNVRNQWAQMRDKFIIQAAAWPVEKGGLGFTIPSIENYEKASDWKKAAQTLFTDSQWAQMEDQIAKPKPEGKDFPKLVVRRGRRSNGGLNIDDI